MKKNLRITNLEREVADLRRRLQAVEARPGMWPSWSPLVHQPPAFVPCIEWSGSTDARMTGIRTGGAQ